MASSVLSRMIMNDNDFKTLEYIALCLVHGGQAAPTEPTLDSVQKEAEEVLNRKTPEGTCGEIMKAKHCGFGCPEAAASVLEKLKRVKK